MIEEGDDAQRDLMFENGLAALRINGEITAYKEDAIGECGVIDKSNNVIIPFIYDDIYSDSNNYFVCSMNYNEKIIQSIFDRTGKEIVPLVFEDIEKHIGIELFTNALCMVSPLFE